MPKVEQLPLGCSRVVWIEFWVSKHQNPECKKGLCDLKKAIIMCFLEIGSQEDSKEFGKGSFEGPPVLERIADIIDA